MTVTKDSRRQLAQWEQRLVEIKDGIGKKAGLIKWGAAAALLVILGPAILTGALAGLFGVAVVIVGLVLLHWMPVIATKIANRAAEAKIAEANRHIAALKAEAQRNPIETLQNEQKQKHAELDKEADAISDFDREVENLRDTVQQEGSRIKSAAGRKKGEEVLAAMERKLKYRRLAFKRAQEKLEVYDAKVEEAEALWRVALAAQKADAASGDNNQDVFRKIMEDTAFHSVASEVNQAMAGLRTSLMKEDITDDDILQLENNPSQVLDVQAVELSEGVRR
jgi:uncharacterized protein YukE